MSWYNEVSRVPKKQIDWDAVKQQSDALDNSDVNRVVANVPKFTAVKEGQQHPVGKNGQMKLFHEHVWPKGYTPARLAGVVDATAGFVQDDVGTNHSGHLQNKIVETMARSTVPTDTLKTLAEYGSITVSNDTHEGEFDADDTSIRINPRVLGKTHQFQPDPSGTVASQITMHELGHMNDYLSDYDDFWKNSNRQSWYSGSGGLMASPALEGRAEGFKMATTRITRGMKRSNEARLGPTAGYTATDFKDTEAQGVFNLNRVKSFRHASGKDPFPHITETPASTEAATPTPLPGMKKFL